MLITTLLNAKRQKISKRIHKLDKRLLAYPNEKKTLDAKKALNSRLKEIDKQMNNIFTKRRSLELKYGE